MWKYTCGIVYPSADFYHKRVLRNVLVVYSISYLYDTLLGQKHTCVLDYPNAYFSHNHEELSLYNA